MDKFEKFKQARSGVVNDLYVDNKPKEDTAPIQQVEKVVEVKQEVKPIVKEDAPKKEKKETKQMLSFRLPIGLIEKIDKYSYVARENKQDVIIKGLEKFFDSKESKDILSQYDEIKK